MNSIERKLVDNTLEYNEWLKNLNNELQLEIKTLKDKIEVLEKPINNPDNRVEAMEKKLDYYDKHFSDSLIWIKPGEKEPVNGKLYLCKVLSSIQLEQYYLLKYDSYNKNWLNSYIAFRKDEIYEYSELPELNKGRN